MALRHFLMVEILFVYLMNGCSNANNEICKTSFGPSTQDWIKWEDNYYKVIMKKMPWLEAKDACAQMGGVMVTPKSENEGRFLARITPLSDHIRVFWINCNDRLVEGTWECDGKADIPYKAWLEVEPNDYGISGEDCGAAYKGGITWADCPCSLHLHVVCKKPVAMLHF